MIQGMGVVPPASKESNSEDGWDYYQNEIWFSAPTFEKLVLKVANFRAANGLPIEGLKQQITDFNASKTAHVVPVKVTKTFRAQIIKWLEAKLRTKPKYVDEAEADRRASICAQCPQNVLAWREGEKCNQCIENANRATAIVLMGRKLHRPLGACRILNQNNQAAVWLDDPQIKDEQLPSFCWRRQS